MTVASKLGRPVRLGLISAGEPVEFAASLRRRHALSDSLVTDESAGIVLRAVAAQTELWTAFSVSVGEGVLDAERYRLALLWLLDAGVDVVVCTCPLQDSELRIQGVNQQARRLGVSIIVADSAAHIDRSDWDHGVVMAASDHSLASDEAIWEVGPERCRVGGSTRCNAAAAGVVAGVAVAELADSLPRTELLDSLRAWTMLPPSRLAS